MAEDVTMVERVARIIHPGAWEPEAAPWCWELLVEKAQQEARGKARAAIEALREPTEAMFDAAYATNCIDERGQGEDFYRAVIDAALAPPTPEDGEGK